LIGGRRRLKFGVLIQKTLSLITAEKTSKNFVNQLPSPPPAPLKVPFLMPGEIIRNCRS